MFLQLSLPDPRPAAVHLCASRGPKSGRLSGSVHRVWRGRGDGRGAARLALGGERRGPNGRRAAQTDPERAKEATTAAHSGQRRSWGHVLDSTRPTRWSRMLFTAAACAGTAVARATASVRASPASRGCAAVRALSSFNTVHVPLLAVTGASKT